MIGDNKIFIATTKEGAYAIAANPTTISKIWRIIEKYILYLDDEPSRFSIAHTYEMNQTIVIDWINKFEKLGYQVEFEHDAI